MKITIDTDDVTVEYADDAIIIRVKNGGNNCGGQSKNHKTT